MNSIKLAYILNDVKNADQYSTDGTMCFYKGDYIGNAIDSYKKVNNVVVNEIVFESVKNDEKLHLQLQLK